MMARTAGADRTTSAPARRANATTARAAVLCISKPYSATRRPNRSVELELVLVVDREGAVLVLLAQEAVADDQGVHLRAHEAAERVLRRADDRLSPDVEAGVDEHRAAGALFELGKQGVVAR